MEDLDRQQESSTEEERNSTEDEANKSYFKLEENCVRYATQRDDAIFNCLNDNEENINNLSNCFGEFKEDTEEKIDNLSILTSSLQGSVKILKDDSINLKYKAEMIESRIDVLESSTKLWKVVNILLIILCLILGFIR